MSSPFPAVIETEEQLEQILSEPTEQVIETMKCMEGDLVFLGVGGKMGPSLARMAQRADEQAGRKRRIIGVARFSNPQAREQLEGWGIETITCDLMDPEQAQRLPDAANVVAMTGMKFGSSEQQVLTWALNTQLPANICRKYQQSRIVAFSTGNVYGLTPIRLGGSVESDELAPIGEYAWSRLGGERVFDYYSGQLNIPMVQLRLNYAHELRYGVIVDIALKVYKEEVIDVTMGHLNALWQGDANAMTLCSFDHVDTPPVPLNLAGPELLSVRRIAEELGELMLKPVRFEGQEAPDAFLSNGQRAIDYFGYPRVGVHQMLRWIARWIEHSGPMLGKPTHFESRDGNY